MVLFFDSRSLDANNHRIFYLTRHHLQPKSVMVVISIKYQNGDGFLFETTTNTLNDDLIKSLIETHNTRLHARWVLETVQNLIIQEKTFETENKTNEEVVTVDLEDTKGTDLDSVDSSSGTHDDLRDTKELHLAVLNKTLEDLKEYMDKTQLSNRTATNINVIRDKIDNVRGAIIRLYPLGLPKSDALMALNWDLNDAGQEDEKGHQNCPIESELLVEDGTKLWCAGKEFVRGQRVSDRLGTNEKTRVVCKLVKSSEGAPMREPVVNEKERDAMMKYYFKRQEELKRLAENEGFEDDYLNSEWADPKQMKRSLQGISNITATGKRFL